LRQIINTNILSAIITHNPARQEKEKMSGNVSDTGNMHNAGNKTGIPIIVAIIVIGNSIS